MRHTIKLMPVVLLIILSSAGMQHELNAKAPVNHEIFNTLLVKYVDTKGDVNYKGIQGEIAVLNSYITTLSQNAPDKSTWTNEEQLAYWINAYNAVMIQLVLKHYPISTVKAINNGSAWDMKVFPVGGQTMSLNDIEHNFVRKNFDEPRIHFVLVCAAKSCPKLRNEAYTAEKLEAQFMDQTRSFLANPAKNKITEDNLQLSKLFSWYEGDFTKNESLTSFLNKYTDVTIGEKPSKKFMTYDWALNEQ